MRKTGVQHLRESKCARQVYLPSSFRVQDLRVESFWSRVDLPSSCAPHRPVAWVQGSGFRVQGTSRSGTGFRVQGTSSHLAPPIEVVVPRRRAQLPWREAGPPNHHDDKVDSDQ